MVGARFHALCGVVLVALILSSPGAALAGKTSVSDFDHSYKGWDGLLRSVVSGGLVDYAAVARDARLERFIARLAAVDPEAVVAWSRTQQVAFYINAYNALTLQTIVDAMPLKSIRDIKPNPWDNARWTVAGRTISLDTIEHKRLRKDLKEPRVHFVLVCAARSCPELPARAILPAKLDEQLDGAARTFFGDPTKNRIDQASARLELSPILLWFGKDFVGWGAQAKLPVAGEHSVAELAVIRTLAAYVSARDREFLSSGSFEVVYNEYDWGLNGR
jgi:hypothetical protein